MGPCNQPVAGNPGRGYGHRMSETRTEHDSMGEVEVPRDALWRAQTQRAIENFPISGLTLAAPRTSRRWRTGQGGGGAGQRRPRRRHRRAGARRSSAAADAIVAGDHDDDFPIDVFQTGSGTSSNMNANEVLATLADARRRRRPPQRPRQRLADQQRHLPDRIHVAATLAVADDLVPALERLADGVRGQGRGVRRHWSRPAART